MQIRLAQKEDSSGVSSLVKSLSRYYLKQGSLSLPLWFTDSIEPESFEQRFSSPYFINFVCIINNDLAGYISIKDGSHLYHLFVSESAQRQGVARSLWDCAKLASSSASYTVRSSLHAVPVYKKFGFNETGLPAEKDGLCYVPMVYHLSSVLTVC